MGGQGQQESGTSKDWSAKAGRRDHGGPARFGASSKPTAVRASALLERRVEVGQVESTVHVKPINELGRTAFVCRLTHPIVAAAFFRDDAEGCLYRSFVSSRVTGRVAGSS